MPPDNFQVNTTAAAEGKIVYSSKRRATSVVIYTTNGPQRNPWPADRKTDDRAWNFIAQMIAAGWDARRYGSTMVLTWIGEARLGRA